MLSRSTKVHGVEHQGPPPRVSDVSMVVGAARMRDWLADLDFTSCRPHEALRMTNALAEIVGAAQAALGRCGVRVEETAAHKHVGARDAEGFLAATGGMSRSDAAGLLDAAKVLDNSETLGLKLRRGTFSGAKARELAKGVQARPDAAAQLADVAEHDSLASVRDAARRCAGAIDAAQKAEDHRRASQCVKIYAGDAGMTRIYANLPPEVAKDVIADLRTRDDALFREDRKKGVHREQPARMVEAMHDMARDAAQHRSGACTSARKPRKRSRHDALVIVNLESLLRGHREGDEVCEVNGIGEISVETALKLLGESMFRIVIRDGVDVRCATSRTRNWKAVVTDLMDFREVRCGVLGCDAILGLERHHRLEFAKGGLTSLDNGTRLCHHHHALVTSKGFSLHDAGKGRWQLRAPGQFGFDVDVDDAGGVVGGVVDTG